MVLVKQFKTVYTLLDPLKKGYLKLKDLVRYLTSFIITI
jgi:Ca2+-binding EF-hand superfamily protein